MAGDPAMVAEPGSGALDDVACRVLGALVEKAFTTPDNYPLSLNALTAACNQTSNREPVMSLTESEVAEGLRTLSGRGLVREVYRSDSRVRRYRHLLEDTLHLHDPEQAALCVLLLRGPQTPGEIKGRTARMFEFIDVSHVEITLRSLIELSTPLAVQLPRQPGHKEVRYAHTLAGEPQLWTGDPSAERPSRAGRVEALEDEVAALRGEVTSLRAEVASLRETLDAFRQEFQ